jgi:hypothetical protein
VTTKNTSMFLIAALAVALLAVVSPAEAQGIYLLKTGALTATNASCTATACVSIQVTSTTGTVAVQIVGTFVGTVAFEASVDGTNFVAVAGAVTAATEARVVSATAPGLWQINAAGYTVLRARCSAFTSGTINVTINRSTAPSGNGS